MVLQSWARRCSWSIVRLPSVLEGQRVTPFDLVIFDCDGVLLDSEIIACSADAEAFCELGYEITGEEIARRFAGMPDEAVDDALALESGRPLPANFRDRIKRRVFEKYRTELGQIDGASDLLSTLMTRKCVASSSAPAKLALGLVETGLYELVYPHIFSTQLVARGKPHPDIFLYAATQMEVPPHRCVVIEDSVAGVTAAGAAGMRSIGFTGGSHCTDGHGARLLAAGASTLSARLAPIPKILEEMAPGRA